MTERSISTRTQSVAIVTAGFGQNIVLTTVTTFILVYLIQFAHISTRGIAVVTAIITAAKIIDAVSDPLVGSIIDRTRTRWGKLRPFVLFSAAPVAILTTLLFSVPDTTESSKLVFFGVAYLLWGIAYSACDVPLWGLIGSAFGESAARNRVVSNVRAFGAIALGLATLGMPWFALALSFSPQTTAEGWSRAVLISTVVGMALYLLAFFFVREKEIAEEHARLSVRQLFGTLFSNTPLILVLLGSVLGFGRLMVQAGGAVFVIIAYRNEGYFTLIGGAVIAGLVLASFTTPLLLKRTTGRSLAIWSSVAGAALYLCLYLVGFSNLLAVVVFIFLSGLTLGVFLVVQATLIADAVDDVEKRTGLRNDGISFATLTFVSKIMSAVAVLVFGLFIVLAGYHDGVHITAAMQQTVWVGLTVVPAISCLLSAVPFLFYRLGGPRAQV
jgi:sugar (glycoside-pentoside-hexuronide) transporter